MRGVYVLAKHSSFEEEADSMAVLRMLRTEFILKLDILVFRRINSCTLSYSQVLGLFLEQERVSNSSASETGFLCS